MVSWPEISIYTAVGAGVAGFTFYEGVNLYGMLRPSGRSVLVGRTEGTRKLERQTSTTFRSVAGNSEAKDQLWDVVDFLRSPERYHNRGVRLPKGRLLTGKREWARRRWRKPLPGKLKSHFLRPVARLSKNCM